MAHDRFKLIILLLLAVFVPLPVVVQARPFLASLFLQSSASSDNAILADTPWPTEQHDFRRTGRSPYQGITTGVGVRWKHELPEYRYIRTANLTIGLSGTLYVKNYWDTAVINAQGQQIQTLPLGGTCRSVPTISRDNTLYYESAAISITGEILWRVPSAGYCTHSTSAFDGNNTVYFGENQSLLAVDTISRTILWAQYLGQYAGGGTPALGEDGTIYVVLPKTK